MNIQTSNINFTLPNSLSQVKPSKLFVPKDISTDSGNTRSQNLIEGAVVNKPSALNALQTLDNITQNQPLNTVTKENKRPTQEIQSYIETANLINQSSRDELHLMLGIDIFA